MAASVPMKSMYMPENNSWSKTTTNMAVKRAKKKVFFFCVCHDLLSIMETVLTRGLKEHLPFPDSDLESIWNVCSCRKKREGEDAINLPFQPHHSI